MSQMKLSSFRFPSTQTRKNTLVSITCSGSKFYKTSKNNPKNEINDIKFALGIKIFPMWASVITWEEWLKIQLNKANLILKRNHSVVGKIHPKGRGLWAKIMKKVV